MRRTLVMVPLSFCALWCAQARAAELERVGVIVQLVVNLDERQALELSKTLGEEIRARYEVDVVAGQEVARRLPPGGIPQDCLTTQACLQDLGRRLDVDTLVFVVLTKLGQRLQIDPTWVNLKTLESRSRDAIRIELSPSANALKRADLGALLPMSKPKQPPAPRKASKPVDKPDRPQSVLRTEPKTASVPAAVWALGGLGAAALISSLGVGIAAARDKSALEADNCLEMLCSGSRVDALRAKALASDLLLGLGLASGAAAALVYFLWPEPAVAPQVSPVPKGVALGLGGRF